MMTICLFDRLEIIVLRMLGLFTFVGDLNRFVTSRLL